MCGIFGVISENPLDENFVRNSDLVFDSLKHRGPDSNGKHETEKAILIHTRLAIIEIEKNLQPVTTSDGRYTLIFNGQIFNYKELNKELSDFGYLIEGKGDAETILYSYLKWGNNVCNYLNGMFAFAIYDSKENSIFLARDRLGIKPLFYFKEKNKLVFSSEIKSFYKSNLKVFEPNKNFFDEFLIWGYVAGESTLHKDIYELPPGSTLYYKNETLRINRYWYPVNQSLNLPINNESLLIDMLEDKLLKSIEYWVKSDVPLSSLLSGGVDSGLITALASKYDKDIITYTAFSPDQPESDERYLAKQTITQLFGSYKNHSEVSLSSMDIVDSISHMIEFLDIPSHAANTNTLMKICENIRKNNLTKVVLCGEGSDEIFGGYYRYRSIANEYKETNNPEILVYAYNRVAIPRLKLLKKEISIPNKSRWEVEKNCLSREATSRSLELDQQTFLCPYLQRQDHIGMMYSLELRTPFLDHNIVEFANALPDKYKIRKDNNGHYWHKYILRKVAERYLDKNIVWNKKKYQFNAPYAQSLQKGALYNLLKLQMRDMILGEYYDTSGINKLLEDHKPGMKGENHSDNSNILWRIINLESWLRSNLK